MEIYKYSVCGYTCALLPSVKTIIPRETVKAVCSRQSGIGAEMLIVCSLKCPLITVYASDGGRKKSDVAGAFAAARYYSAAFGSDKTRFAMGDGIISAEVKGSGEISLTFPTADFSPASVGTIDRRECVSRDTHCGSKCVKVTAMNMCGVRSVVISDDAYGMILYGIAESLSENQLFSHGTDVDIISSVNSDYVKLLSYERHAGYVGLSPTGACAAVSALDKLGLRNRADFMTEHGKISVAVSDKIIATANVKKVMHGNVFI